MKKVVLLAAVLAMSASAAFAQHFEWGVKAGLNLAKQTKFDGVKMRVGLHVGVFGEYVISDFWGVQGELLYSQMGSKREYEIDDLHGMTNRESSTNDFLYKNNYIVLPILAKLYVWNKLSVDLGPQFGYMISAKEGSFNYYKEFVETKFDVSVAMGLSYKFFGKLDVSARYNLGLTKPKEVYNTANRVIQFGVGYRF